MSAKWRALQRRHRWTYETILLPSSYLETLHSLPPSFAKFKFFDEVFRLSSLTSIHSQVTTAKKLVAAFSELVCNRNADEALHAAMSLYLEILFQENSLPLHRTLLSVFGHNFPATHHTLVKDRFELLCKEYGLMGCKSRRFALAPVALSIMSLPKAGFLQEVAEQCATTMALNACNGLQSVLQESNEGGRPSPSTMEQCQEAMSSLYYLLQKFPQKFIPQNVQDHSISRSNSHFLDPIVYEAVVKAILDVLKSLVFSRDCMVAAGVSFCAAAQMCVSGQQLAFMLANAIFHQAGTKFAIVTSDQGVVETCDQALLEAAVMKLYKRDLAAEIEMFTDFGRLCLLRGILTSIQRPVLNINLLLLGQNARPEESKSLDNHTNMKEGSIGREDQPIWTILFDGILPVLCNLCESSIDSHFNFHAVTAMQICLQQIRASVSGHLTALAERELRHAAKDHGIAVKLYNPFPEIMVSRILKIIWNNWEDPLNQTVKQVQIAFELLIDVQSLLFKTVKQILAWTDLQVPAEEKDDRTRDFLHKLASELLLVGGHRKGRYVPLASLAQRLGAKNLLSMSPNLLFETVQAYMDDDVCCSATSFLKCFLERLREDCWSSEGGVEEGYRIFRRLWIPPILSGLVSGFPKLRSNLNTYALPVALQIDGDSIFLMLAFASNGQTKTTESMNGILSWIELDGAIGLPGALTVDQHVAATISLLKVARSLALIEGDIDWYPPVSTENDNESMQKDINSFAVVHVKGLEVLVPVQCLKLALTHMDDSLRIDAAELLFLNPKTSSLPSTLELGLMRTAIPLNMRCCSTAFRMKWTSLFKKYFSRVRTAIERQRKQVASKLHANFSSNEIRGGLQEGFSLITNSDKKAKNSTLDSRVGKLNQFMRWLSRLLVFSLYPSAPYERKSMAMELFLAMIDIWCVNQPLQQQLSQYSSSSSLGSTCHYPYDQILLLADSTLLLVGAIVDSWDRLRETAFRILLQFPTPLPGIADKLAVKEVIMWAKTLVSSPRVRESDAGALTLRLLFRKYVQELGWIVRVAQDEVSESPSFKSHSPCKCVLGHRDNGSNTHIIASPEGEYIHSLIDWLSMRIEEGEKDLVKACEHSFVHGVLLTLRYTIEELDWISVVVRADAFQLRAALERLLGLVVRVTSLALWVVSADAWNMPESMDNIFEDEDLHLGPQTYSHNMEEPVLVNELQEVDSQDVETVGPVEQVVMVGCWLAMKEVSLLLGTITRKVPLPGYNSGHPDRSDTGNETGMLADSVKQIESFDAVLDLKQLEIIGEHFLQVLLAMKHNGAIDKTRAGFTALCNRLLCSSDPRLNQMPKLWMKQLMERTVAKGQTVDDLLRRSAGIPAAFIALFLAEPEGTPKKLLPLAMRWLIDVAKSFLSKSVILSGNLVTNDNLAGLEEENESLKMVPETSLFPPGTRYVEINASKKVSKQRDEGVVPTVHAFNALKVAFHDTNLSTDTSGFCAEALVTAIQSFSSHYWEVRNSATLAFTALVHRMIGFLNVHKRESARRAMTGFEFFHRYPTLHPFLLEELHSATEQLEESDSQSWRGNKLGRSLHPSLGPILIILSRLRPSMIGSGTEDWLNPSAFMPYVRRCATQRNLRVRILASKALAPLVSAENLLNILLDLASGLPKAGWQTVCSQAVSSIPEVFAGLSNGTLSCEINYCMERKIQPMCFNSIHGILLQMDSLLTTNCMSIPDVVKKDQIISALIPVLESCSWIGSVRLCSCPMVTGAYLKVLEDLLEVAGTCTIASHISTIRNMLLHFSSECLDASVMRSQEFFDSTRTDLRQQAAAFYFNAVLARHPAIPCKGGPRLCYEMQHLTPRSLPYCYNSESLESSSKYVDSSRFVDTLRCCLSDTMYEVRLATLKVLHRFLKSLEFEADIKLSHTLIGDSYHWTKITLQPMLINCLEHEKNPKCLRHILRVLFTCNSLNYTNSNNVIGEDKTNLCWDDFNMLLNFWHKLLAIQGTARHVKTKEILICCLGVCIRQFTKFIRYLFASGLPCFQRNRHADYHCTFDNAEQWNHAHQCIGTWIALIKKYSAPHEPLNMRKATAEGIVASGLLEQASWIGAKISNQECPLKTLGCVKESGESTRDQSTGLEYYARAILDTWFTCIKLLEDEDVNLRKKLSLAVLRSVSSTECINSNLKNVVPAQVERVLELSFDFLTASFGHWSVYFDYLANRVLGSEDTSVFMTKNGDFVRRLFDKELDNHHEERLLICQLCCLHLQRLLDAKILEFDFQGIELSFGMTSTEDSCVSSRKEIEGFIHTWRMRFLCKIISLAKHCIDIEGRVSWVGGIVNHQDIFKALYPCLLGLYAFACQSLGKEHHYLSQKNCREELSSSLIELTGLMTPLLSNPIISSLAVTLLEAYENQLTINLGSRDLRRVKASNWCEDFDPYFLVK